MNSKNKLGEFRGMVVAARGKLTAAQADCIIAEGKTKGIEGDITAKELKGEIKDVTEFHVIGLTDDGSWWHVHDDERVPKNWALGPFPQL